MAGYKNPAIVLKEIRHCTGFRNEETFFVYVQIETTAHNASHWKKIFPYLFPYLEE